MKYQNLTLSEEGLKNILNSGTLSYEDYEEVERALSVIEDEETLDKNLLNNVPIPRGTVIQPKI